MMRASTLVVLGLTLMACGSGDAPATDDAAPAATSSPAAAPAVAAGPTGPLSVPEWFAYDETANTVGLEIVAGATDAKNYWNFNGYTDGAIAVTVPAGSTVTIEFRNDDPVMGHSLGISTETANFSMPPTPSPAFPGAITEDPASMVSSTLPGESETIQFVAGEAGRYSMVCYIAGHTAVGMWIFFDVSDDGSFGVRGL